MNASFDKGATLIALRPFDAAGRSFSPGDEFPWRRLAIAERRVAQMIDLKRVGVLSQETYEFALAQREPGDTVPKGFTRDGLEALNLTVPPPEAAKPAKPEKAGPEYDSTEIRGALIIGKKMAGIMPTYDVLNVEGGRLNTARLRGKKSLDKFLDQLAAMQATIAAHAETILADDPNTAALVSTDTALDGEGEGGGDAAAPAEPGDPPADGDY
jgi:hypothetical protein